MEHNEYPVLYKDNMFKRDNPDTAKIKLFINNDWIWVEIQIKQTKIEKRNVAEWKVCNPKLIKVGKKYFLATPNEKNITINKSKIKYQNIVYFELVLSH